MVRSEQKVLQHATIRRSLKEILECIGLQKIVFHGQVVYHTEDYGNKIYTVCVEQRGSGSSEVCSVNVNSNNFKITHVMSFVNKQTHSHIMNKPQNHRACYVNRSPNLKHRLKCQSIKVGKEKKGQC